ncbi:MAG: DUF4115 domain-containing protein [Armatimonadota bacterium]|nr:DUF4115 domain-containing protein [Armatimonadota bacterium]
MQAPSGFGETFRRAREARRLSLADAERITKIRAAYLAALEEERLNILPPPPYSKGFVRAYARLLGLDAERLLAEVSGRLPPPSPDLTGPGEVPLEPARPMPRWRRVAALLLWAALLFGLYAAYVGYTQLREFSRPVPTAGPEPSPLQASPVPATVPPSPAPVKSPPPPAAGVTLVLSTTGRSWLRVAADGQRVFQGILEAGETRTWSAMRDLSVRIGNAAAVQLSVNGRPLGPLGRPGQVVELRFPRPPEEP